jgi:NitT/TauT family transport system permease protein
MRPVKYFSISMLSVLTLFLLWYLASWMGLIKPSVFPTPADLYATFTDLLTHGYSNKSLLTHVTASMVRAMTGFLLAVLVGVPAGLLIGYSIYASAILAPIFTFLRPIPAIAFIPLVILYFGIGETSKIAVVFMTSMLYVVLAVAEGVKSVPRVLIRVAENLGVSRWEIFKSVIFPGTLPHIVTGIKTATALSWALVVAAEMIAAQEGLGYMIMDSATFYRVNYIYIGIAAIGLIAFALERLVTLLERRLVHWVGRQ